MDANDLCWENYLAQVSSEDFASDEAVEDMHHKPLAFLSKRFKRAQLGWPTVGKEGYAIVSDFKPREWMFYVEVAIFTDNRNLTYISSVVLVAKLPKTTAQRLLQWHTYLGKFYYEIMHTPGEE